MEAEKREEWSYAESGGPQNTSTRKSSLTVLAQSKGSILSMSIVLIDIIQQPLNKFSLFPSIKCSDTFAVFSDLHCRLFPSAGHHITAPEHLLKALNLEAVKKPKENE